MKAIILSLLFLSFTSCYLFAQDIPKANQLITQGNRLIEKGELEQAHYSYTEAADIYQKASDWSSLITCARLIIDNLIQAEEYELGLTAGEKYLQLVQDQKVQTLDLSLLNKNLGTIYYLIDEYKKALPYLENALNIRQALNAKDPELARDYGNLGIISRFSNRYHKAISYVERAISLQKDKNVLARLYNELGVNYRLLGDYRKSLDQQNQAILILEASENQQGLAYAYMEKGATLTVLKRKGEDLVFLKKALAIFKDAAKPDYVNQVNCYKLMATSYFQFEAIQEESLGLLDSALSNYQRAFDIAQQNLPKGSLLTSQLVLDLSSVYTRQAAFSKASEYLDAGEQLLEGQIEPVSIEAADFFKVKADFSISKADYKAALEYLQEQINALIPGYGNLDIYSLPTIAQLKQGLSFDKLQDALAAKARCWNLYYKYQKQDLTYLEEAFRTIQLFDELIDNMRIEFARGGSNIAWSDLTLDAYESAIRICVSLAQRTEESKYKEKALYYSEKSKALSLLESFQNTKAKLVGGLSSELLEQEREMMLDITDLKKAVFLLEQQEPAASQQSISTLRQALFDKQTKFNAFVEQLEQDYPQYHTAKYEMNILTLDEIRNLLKPSQAMVEYFVGDSAVYAFKITKNDFELIELGRQENLLKQVKDLRKSVYGFFLSNKDRGKQVRARYAKEYSQQAYAMYQLLIAPLGSLPQRLLIVPAGPLCDMPFEMLLNAAVDKAASFNRYPYLIQKHVFSYSYSATLLGEMISRKHEPAKEVYAGFAPSFGEHGSVIIRGQSFNFSPLAFNGPEVEAIQDLLGFGDIFKGEEATENTFKEVAANYSILHLATHGMANTTDPDFSLLAFTEVADTLENEYLYVSDLYNMDINADMVVLSACETALGKTYRGEGVISMARGFSFAGAKSIFTTLWSVNDNSTYAIVKDFYSELQKGADKDIALQKAKISYISRANDLAAHPFLWAPYILVGDSSSLPPITVSYLWYYLGAAGLLIGAMLLLWLRKKRASM